MTDVFVRQRNMFRDECSKNPFESLGDGSLDGQGRPSYGLRVSPTAWATLPASARMLAASSTYYRVMDVDAAPPYSRRFARINRLMQSAPTMKHPLCILAACIFTAASILATASATTFDDSDSEAGPKRIAGRTLDEWATDLHSKNRIVRLRAIRQVAAFDATAVGVLEKSLKHNDAAVRYWAAYGLGDVGETTKTGLKSLEAMLAEKTPIRISAAYALCRNGRVEQGLPHLTKALEYPERGTAVSAADFLARIGPPAKDAVPALEKTVAHNEKSVKGGDYHVHNAALEALRRIRESE